MPRVYESFAEMEKSVSDTCKTFYALRNKLGGRILSAEGNIYFEVYAALQECFCFSESKADLVTQVADVIRDIRVSIRSKPLGVTHTRAFVDEQAEIAKLLRKYIRHNCERELWENVPEFKTPTE